MHPVGKLPLASPCRPVPVETMGRFYCLWLSRQVQQEQDAFSVTNSLVVQLFTFVLAPALVYEGFFCCFFSAMVMCFLFVPANIKAGSVFLFPTPAQSIFPLRAKVLEAEVGKLYGLKAFQDIKVSDWKCRGSVVPQTLQQKWIVTQCIALILSFTSVPHLKKILVSKGDNSFSNQQNRFIDPIWCLGCVWNECVPSVF